MEPPACESAFTTTASGLHYIYGGGDSAEVATTIKIFNPTNEEWTLQPTNGTLPPGQYDGGCDSIGNDMYIFGSYSGSSLFADSRFNDLYKLNLETYQWSKVQPRNDQTNWPRPKYGCGFAAVDERTLCCFGGYIGDGKRTNEFHLYDVQEGTNYNNSLLYFVFIHVLRVCQLIQLLTVYTHIVSTW